MPGSIVVVGQLKRIRSHVEDTPPKNKRVPAGALINLSQDQGCDFYTNGKLPQCVKNYFGMTETHPVLSFKTSSYVGNVRHRVVAKVGSKCFYSFGYKIDTTEPFKVHMQNGLFYGGILRRGSEETFEFYEQPESNKNSLSIHTKKEGFFCEDGFLIEGVQICKSDPGTELEEINFHQGVFYERGGGLKYGKATIKLPGDDQEVVCEGEFSESGCLKK